MPDTSPRAEPAATAVVGRRCAQFALDRLLVVVPLLVVGVLLGRALAPAGVRERIVFDTVLLGVLFAVAVAGFLAVDVWWPHRHHGQTPAMRWLGLRITGPHGTAPTLGALFLRWLLLAVDGFLWGLAGLVIMLCGARHQRLGDLVASTTVIRA